MLWVEVTMTLVLSSAAFVDSGTIPQKFTCDGANVSPALTWSGTPANTQTLALIADDPDAPGGTWVHWVLFNLPGKANALPENVARDETLSSLGNAVQGRNDFKKLGYGGPCPPPGKPHRYFFKLYALDTPLALHPGATKAQVEDAMQGHIVATAQLIGTYARKR
jgi:Raf kinase inhibitor-like YbhB/YbcL family protein